MPAISPAPLFNIEDIPDMLNDSETKSRSSSSGTDTLIESINPSGVSQSPPSVRSASQSPSDSISPEMSWKKWKAPSKEKEMRGTFTLGSHDGLSGKNFACTTSVTVQCKKRF
jgi:hypothetical protein